MPKRYCGAVSPVLARGHSALDSLRYNWDEAGGNGIERIAAKLGEWVYYLGGLAEGQDPYDMLKPVVNAISGFSLKHLKTDKIN